MRKRFYVIHVLAFSALLILPSVLWALCYLFGWKDSLDFDTGEKRNKYQISEEVSINTLPGELEAWYDDRVPFRSVLLKADKSLENLIEKPYKEGIQPMLLSLLNRKSERQKASAPAETTDPVKDSGDTAAEKDQDETAKEPSSAGGHEHSYQLVEHLDPDVEHYGYDKYRCSCGEEKQEIIEKLIDDSFYPYTVDNMVIEGRYGWLFYSADEADYTGSNLPDKEELAAYALAFQELSDICEENGIAFYGISFPNKSRIYSEYMPTIERSETWRLQEIENYLNTFTSVSFSYLYEEMLVEKPAHDLYCKLDTHWNAFGSLVGLNTMHQMLGLPEIDLDSLQTTPYDRYGDLAHLQGTPRTEPSERVYYRPEVSRRIIDELDDDGHGFFERGVVEVVSDSPNDETLVMIGDSFQIALMDSLPADYAHVFFVNRDKLGEIDESIITQADILFFEFVERNASSEGWDLLSAVYEISDIIQGGR